MYGNELAGKVYFGAGCSGYCALDITRIGLEIGIGLTVAALTSTVGGGP